MRLFVGSIAVPGSYTNHHTPLVVKKRYFPKRILTRNSQSDMQKLLSLMALGLERDIVAVQGHTVRNVNGFNVSKSV